MSETNAVRKLCVGCAAAWIFAGIFTGVLPGCSSQPKAVESSPVRDTPEAVAVDDADAEGVDDRTAELLRLMEQAQRHSEIDLDRDVWESDWGREGDAVFPGGRVVEQRTEPEVGAMEEAAVDVEDVIEIEASEPERVETRAERMDRLSAELAGALRGEFDEADLALGIALRAHALETIRPGTLQSHFPELALGSSWAGLSEPERKLLDAWRELNDAMGVGAELGDVGALAETVGEAGERVRALRGLRVTEALLATRVENFGIYTEVERRGDVYRFVAGQRRRVVVYTEVENFARRSTAKGGVDGYGVELTQSLSLSHLGADGGDLVAWSMPEQTVDYFSRRPVRDFFLTAVIDLPETLTVDRYALKVRVRDRVTGAEAERVIRIDMVAHPSALR